MIETIFAENDIIIKNLINQLRSIKTYMEYSSQKIYENFKQRLNLNDDFFPVESSADGNCLYNSISLILFEHENYFFIVKACSLYIIFEYKQYFNYLLNSFGYEISVEEFIQNSFRKNEWGNDLNILSISILLNKTIFCYSPSKNLNLNFKYIYSLENNKEKPLFIGLCDNHFFPILIKKDFSLLLKVHSIEIDYLNEKKKIEIKIY